MLQSVEITFPYLKENLASVLCVEKNFTVLFTLLHDDRKSKYFVTSVCNFSFSIFVLVGFILFKLWFSINVTA